MLPERDTGFLRAVATMYRRGASPPRDCRGAEIAMRATADRQDSADTVIRASLDALGVTGDDIEPFLFATALALPGWCGMFARLERNPADNPPGPPVTLADILAVRLLL